MTVQLSAISDADLHGHARFSQNSRSRTCDHSEQGHALSHQLGTKCEPGHTSPFASRNSWSLRRNRNSACRAGSVWLPCSESRQVATAMWSFLASYACVGLTFRRISRISDSGVSDPVGGANSGSSAIRRSISARLAHDHQNLSSTGPDPIALAPTGVNDGIEPASTCPVATIVSSPDRRGSTKIASSDRSSTLSSRWPGGEGRVRGAGRAGLQPTSPSPALSRRGPSLSPLKGREGLFSRKKGSQCGERLQFPGQPYPARGGAGQRPQRFALGAVLC